GQCLQFALCQVGQRSLARKSNLVGEIVAEIGEAFQHPVDCPDQLLSRGILDHVACRTCVQCPRDDNRIAVDAQDQDSCLRIAAFDAFHKCKAGKAAALEGQIDDDHVGDVAEKLSVAVSDVLRLDDPFNANVLKDAPAALQQNWMIIDNQNTS